MSIRMVNGCWTVFVEDRPVICCRSFQDAWREVYALACELAAERSEE